MSNTITRMYARQKENLSGDWTVIEWDLVQSIENDTLTLNKETWAFEGGFETEETILHTGTIEEIAAFESLRCNNVTIELLKDRENESE